MAEVLWHNLSEKETADALRSDLKRGLGEEEIALRQKEFGKNKLPEEKGLPWFRIFSQQFQNPLIYILLIAAIVTFVLKEYTDAAIILGVVFLNVIIGFIQENKSAKTLKELKKIIKYRAEVLRKGNLKIIEAEELVPGDVVILNPGDNVPADGRVLESHNLKVNEMTLTGEWLSTKKSTGALAEETVLADRSNMLYMGTVVEEGKGKMIVTETGSRTKIGEIAQSLLETKEEKTPYQKKIANFGKLLGLIILFLCLLIFIIGLATGQNPMEIFLTAVAIAVAAIPEGLPMAVTLVFTFGMQEILKRKGLVRKMVAAETLGSTSIIATDKTATLTEGKMKVEEVIGDKFLTLKAAVLTSEAFIENPDEPKEKWQFRGRPTERAILEAGVNAGIDGKREFERKKINDIPFNPINKFAAALYKGEENEKVLYLCGAPEKILGFSKLTAKERSNLENLLEKSAGRGLRIVATAYKKFRNPKLKTENLLNLCNNLKFLGFITLKDPVRATAKTSIRICREAGMRPIIVTGDHKLTAKSVAEELGLKIKEENILEGKELDVLSDRELDKILDKIHIYARVEPRHKLRIITALKRKGEVVAMTGDGVNDAPALKKADIGVALGSGTDVAKAASDLTLLSDDFEIIITAVEEGRRIIDNVRKIITYLLVGGFTEVMLIGLAIICRLPLPVLPGQILWKNMIESTPPSFALTFEPEEKDVMKRKPEPLHLPMLTKEMNVLIFFVGLFTNLILFGIFLWFWNNNYPLDRLRTVMFVGLTIDSFFFIFSCRNLRKNIWQYNPFSNFYLTVTIILGFVFLIAAVYWRPLQVLLKTAPFGLFEWGVLVAFGLLNLILVEMVKWYFIKKDFK